MPFGVFIHRSDSNVRRQSGRALSVSVAISPPRGACVGGGTVYLGRRKVLKPITIDRRS
jgi:hypothetical protein